MNQKAKAELEFLADIVDKCRQPIGVGYPDGRLGFCNRAFCELTGYTAEELNTANWSETLTPPEWLPDEMKALQKLERTGIPVQYQKEYIRKDGIRVPIDMLVHVVKDKAGVIRHYYAFVTDITERKRQEHLLRERVKELGCLIGELEALSSGVDLEEVIQRSVEQLPTGWQYPEITVAEIRIDEQLACSGDFAAVVAVQSADVVVGGTTRGRVAVGYTEACESLDEGPFLRQERELIDAIAHNLGGTIERIEAEEQLRAANQQLEAGNQQLRATEQQLRAYNQQIRATEQQLRAYNQQLRATEQQLRAYNQQLEAAEIRNRHLNAVLRGVRDVNRLIAREGDPKTLIRKACEILVSSRGFEQCCIVLWDGACVSAMADAGDVNKVKVLRRMLEKNEVPECLRLAIDAGEPILRPNPLKSCAACPVNQDDTSERDAVSVRLENQGEVLGAMLVSFPEVSSFDSLEIELLQEVAADVALALRSAAMETDLHRSEVRFREAFDGASIGRVLTRPDGRLDRVNNALCEMLGYSREELEGENFAAITAPDDMEESRRRVRCILAGEQKSCRFEKRYLHRDGHAVWTEVITTLLRDERGEPLHFITDIIDITAQKRAEAAVRDHERELALTLEATTDGIWKWDFRTGELFFSPRYYVMLGYEPDEFPAGFEAWRDLLHPDDRAPAIAVAEVYLAAKPDTYENRFRLRTKNGEYRFIEAHARVVERDVQGNAVRMIGHHVDITDRLKAEEERTRVITMSSELICIADLNTYTFLEINPAFEQVLGHSKATLLSRPFLDFVHPDDLAPTQRVVEAQLRRGAKVLSFVNRYRCADGSYRWLDWNSSPDYKRGRTYAIARDITERKQAEDDIQAANQQLRAAEQELRRQERRSRALVDHSPVCHKIVDLDFNLQYMSASGFRMLKLAETDERYSKPYPFDFFPQGARETLSDALSTVKASGETVDFDALACDAEGNPVWLHHNIIPVFKEDGAIDYMTVVSADVTERKQREAALRQFEWLNDKEQLESDTTADAYTPPYGDVTALNTCRVIADAVDKEALADMGRDLMDLLDTSVAVYEKNGDYAFGMFDSAWCRLLDRASFAQCKTDDTKEALRCGSWLCHENCWNESALAAIRSGAHTDIECVGGIRLYAVPIKAGGEIVGALNIGYNTPPGDEPSLRALAVRFALPLDAVQDAARDYKPRPRYVIDVAKRRCRSVARMIGDAVHKSRLEAQLAQADRLSSMGTLAAGVAHEINNPLAYTLYNLETVVDDLPSIFSEYRRMVVSLNATSDMDDENRVLASGASELEALLGRAREALDGAERIRSIARTLGTFARVDDAKEAPIDIRHAAEHARNMARNETKYRAQLLLDLSPTPPVVGSEGKLAQVFLNLLINAAHAIDEGDVDGNSIRIRTYADGNAVIAEVSDTGKGIARENLKRLFDPFFTTKPVGEGSGLGLAISKKIIADMGGDITCESREGCGTTFRIRLPAFCEDAGRRQEMTSPANSSVPHTGGRVLAVDDEPGIRDLLCHMLVRDNHEVTTAASGAEGKAILELDQAFDLIILDLMMPQVSGMDLHRWLADTYPELAERVIFVTGGVFTPGARDYLAKVDNMRFEKPLDTKTFRKIVRNRIAGRGIAPPSA